MATCKYCGKSGFFHTVTKNGMCPNCETFVLNDLKTRSRIFNESKDIVNKSENPDVVFSRLKTAKESLIQMTTYEKKGIGIFHPPPSQLLREIENDQDDIIFGCFERGYKTLQIKIINLKSPSAVANNLKKFINKIDEFLPQVRDKTSLSELRKTVESSMPVPEYKNKTARTNTNLLEITSPNLPQQKIIQIKEIHPAKLLIIENQAPRDMGLLGGIHISINLNGENQVEIIGPNEPSTIYKDLPVKTPISVQSLELPPYFPSYRQLTPEQRWVYIDWVKDISQPVDIGYVFIYYYGLERNLLIGDFNTAYDEILFLRHYHDNKSFEAYSYNALLFASAIKNKPDLIQKIIINESRNGIDNVDLLFKYRFSLGITPEELMSLARKFKGVNLRYIKANPDRYKIALSIILTDKYGQSEYPLTNEFDINDIPQTQSIAFANISFPNNLRLPRLPDFIKHIPFATDCASLFETAHQLVKEDLIRERQIHKD